MMSDDDWMILDDDWRGTGDDWRGTGKVLDVSPKVKICYVYFR